MGEFSKGDGPTSIGSFQATVTGAGIGGKRPQRKLIPCKAVSTQPVTSNIFQERKVSEQGAERRISNCRSQIRVDLVLEWASMCTLKQPRSAVAELSLGTLCSVGSD